MTNSTELSEFRKAQIDRMDNSRDITVKELLALAIDDIDSGRITNPKRCMIVIVEEAPNGSGEMKSYRANMDRAEEIGYLTLSIDKVIKSWLASG